MRQRRFLILALSLLVLLHLYIGLRILPALPIADAGRLVGVLYLILSTLLIPAGFGARRLLPKPLAERLVWPGLLAIGFGSSLLVLTLLREITLLIALPLLSDADLAALSRTTALGVPLLSLLLSIIGFCNARRTARVVEVRIPLANLPPVFHNFSIVQISDIHVGPTIKRDYLDAIVQRVNELDADMVAITGDLVDGRVETLGPQIAPLARLRARHGSYFVTGNHDYYSGARGWIRELRRLGVRVLLNEHEVLQRENAALVIAGITDYSAHLFEPEHRSDPQKALAGAPSTAAAKILLAHQPRSCFAAEQAGFDVQLSGHTHGGQFLPWNFFVPLQQPFVAGLKQVGRLQLYISRGTGYWGPPIRLGAPSEITRIRLVAASGNATA